MLGYVIESYNELMLFILLTEKYSINCLSNNKQLTEDDEDEVGELWETDELTAPLRNIIDGTRLAAFTTALTVTIFLYILSISLYSNSR